MVGLILAPLSTEKVPAFTGKVVGLGFVALIHSWFGKVKFAFPVLVMLMFCVAVPGQAPVVVYVIQSILTYDEQFMLYQQGVYQFGADLAKKGLIFQNSFGSNHPPTFMSVLAPLLLILCR